VRWSEGEEGRELVRRDRDRTHIRVMAFAFFYERYSSDNQSDNRIEDLVCPGPTNRRAVDPNICATVATSRSVPGPGGVPSPEPLPASPRHRPHIGPSWPPGQAPTREVDQSRGKGISFPPRSVTCPQEHRDDDHAR